MFKKKRNSRNSKNKAQIEIMGLMIIVVMISLIILFAITAVFLKDPKDFAGDFSRQELSSSIIGAMLRTSSGCTEDTSLEDLFIAAAKGSPISCTITTSSVCSQSNSNEFLKCAVQNILDNTLGTFKLPYEFIAKESGGVINQGSEDALHISSGLANTTISSGTASPYTLPIYPSNEVIELWLCVGNNCPSALTGVEAE